MQRRVQRSQQSQSQPKTKTKTEKVVREVGPRREEVIQSTKRRNEYMDNFSYHETKDLKRNNPRYFVVVEHTRKGDIFGGGNFEQTSYERQVYSQGGNRPKLEGNDKVRGKRPAQTSATQQVTKKTTTTTSTRTNNTRKSNPVSATATHEKVQQTTMKRRNDGTVSKTESRTETKTTTSGVRGQKKESTTSKTTTRTTSQRPAGGQTQTSTTTKTTTTRTRRGA